MALTVSGRDPMSRLRQLIAYFASPPDQQAGWLPGLPFDRGNPTYYTAFEENPLWLLSWGLLEEASFRDDLPIEDFYERTGLPGDTRQTALAELLWCGGILRQVGGPDGDPLFTARGLREQTGWKVVRRLARLTLSDLGWSAELDADRVRDLLAYYRREQRESLR
jgi:hypothetical protein